MHTKTVSWLRSALGALAASATLLGAPTAHAGLITFNFDYSGNDPGVGFLDSSEGLARRQALTTAGNLFSDLFSSYFSNSANLTYSITSSFAPNGSTLASTGSDGINAAGFGNGEVIRNKLQNGVDLNGAASDGFVNVNWGHIWNIDPNTAANDTQFDFFAAIYHEFTHSLGFGSNIPGNGSTPGAFTKWDQYLTDKDGNRVVNPISMEVNIVAYVNAQENGGLFDGSNATAAYGQPVPLVVDPDISHLNTDAFSPPSVSGPYMMVPFRSEGPQEARTWSPTEIGILADLGYSRNGPSEVPEPSSLALLGLGLALAGFSAKRRLSGPRV